jgi:hypothetical protein
MKKSWTKYNENHFYYIDLCNRDEDKKHAKRRNYDYYHYDIQ